MTNFNEIIELSQDELNGVSGGDWAVSRPLPGGGTITVGSNGQTSMTWPGVKITVTSDGGLSTHTAGTDTTNHPTPA